jgi:hypothetical protein
MTTETNLTALELSVLRAIDASEYGDVLTDEIWMFSVTDNMEAGGATPKQLPGVVSSLVKKGLVKSGGTGNDAGIHMTDAGATAYVLAVCYDRKKATRSEGWEAFKRNKEAASKPL